MTSYTRHAAPAFDYQPETWMDDAACIGHPTDWWFPTNEEGASTETTHTAKAICGDCPVRAACLEYAMRTESGFQRSGIFGGLTPDARRRLEKAAS